MRTCRNVAFCALVFIFAALAQQRGAAFTVFDWFENAYNCGHTVVWQMDGVATNWCDCGGEPNFCDPYYEESALYFCDDWWSVCEDYCDTLHGYAGYTHCEVLGYVECGCDGIG